MTLLSAEPSPTTNAVPSPNAEAQTQVTNLHEAWKSEKAPAKRAELADQLVEAIIHYPGDLPLDIADDVARDGVPQKSADAPKDATKVALQPVMTLPNVHSIDYPKSPVFRRISATHFEAWTIEEGWLFDQHGKVAAHLTVPRRDGTGRQWFGAFLPNGRWITTDLWEEDKQVNAFDVRGHWLWHLTGAKILAANPLPKDSFEPHPKPLIDWARADKTGTRWLISVGENLSMTDVLVNQNGVIAKLPKDASPWSEVYPRSMGVRGGYVSFDTDSDDNKASLGFVTVAHGPYSGWPSFNTNLGWGVRMHDTTLSFGFWPRSHAVYIEQSGSEGPDSKLVWVFDEKGHYCGEVQGSYFGDAANGKNLLFTDLDHRVLDVALDRSGLTVPRARQFYWSDGLIAVPVTLYDDLHLGFFKRNPGIFDSAIHAGARETQDIVLASFQN